MSTNYQFIINLTLATISVTGLYASLENAYFLLPGKERPIITKTYKKLLNDDIYVDKFRFTLVPQVFTASAFSILSATFLYDTFKNL